MRRSSLFCLFLLSCAFGQQVSPPAPAGQLPEIVTITPDTVIAKINGKDFTASDLERLTKNLTGHVRDMAGTEPQMFLNQYAWSEKLTSEAEKMRVELTSPWKERLEDSRRQILVQGLIQRKRDDISISDEDVKKYFDANKDNFRQANAKVIFVSRASYSANLADGVVKTPDPLEAKRKADKVAKLAREGGDFVALAKEHSDDRATAEKSADLPYSIRSGSSEIPQNIREPIMKAKTGDIIGPIEHETGFYLFKVTSSGMSSLREAKQDIVRNLKEAEVKRWMDELRTKASATLDHKAFWDTFVATNKLALGKKAEQKDQEPSK